MDMVTPTTEEYPKAIRRLQAGESRVAPSDETSVGDSGQYTR